MDTVTLTGKNIVIILVVLLVGVVLGVLVALTGLRATEVAPQQVATTAGTQTSTSTPPLPALANVEGAINCTDDASKDVGICAESRLFSEAMKERSVSKCDGIESAAGKQKCIDTVTAAIAAGNGDESVCSALEGEAERQCLAIAQAATEQHDCATGSTHTHSETGAEVDCGASQ